jgi:hypothetical protein
MKRKPFKRPAVKVAQITHWDCGIDERINEAVRASVDDNVYAALRDYLANKGMLFLHDSECNKGFPDVIEFSIAEDRDENGVTDSLRIEFSLRGVLLDGLTFYTEDDREGLAKHLEEIAKELRNTPVQESVDRELLNGGHLGIQFRERKP